MNKNLDRRIHPIAEADGLSPKKPRKFDGSKVHAGISCKKLKFINISRSFLINQLKRLAAIPPTNEFVGFLADLS